VGAAEGSLLVAAAVHRLVAGIIRSQESISFSMKTLVHFEVFAVRQYTAYNFGENLINNRIYGTYIRRVSCAFSANGENSL
jgi:hypothetical protein